MSKITAPFTAQQIDALNTWQRWGATRPFTCPKHQATFQALAEGWRCPIGGCTHSQDWAYEFMVLAKYCTKENIFDSATADPSEYWIHVDAFETHPDYEGGIVGFKCPTCGLEFDVDCR
jgi:hypothetical protein